MVYYCNDSLNNLATKTVVFGVDAVPPQISLNYPAPNSYSRNSTIQFNYTPMASDGLDTCELWGNWIGTWHKNDSTTALVNYSGNYFIKTLRDGTYLWNIWCNNTNGYTDWSMQGNITFSIDNTAPYVSFVLPAAVSYNSSLISVEITNSSDVSSVWWFNGTENISYISSLDLSLSDGTYNFIAYANDSAGNLNSTPVSFNVDTSYSLFYNYRDNNASLVGINSGGNYGGGIGFFNISINNTNGSVLLRINSTNIPALNLNENIYNVNYSFITAGVYEYYWQAYSNGTSHLLSNSETYYYSINSSDNASANIILNTPENNSYTNFTAINFTANLSDITLVAGDTESGIKNATLNIYNSSGIVNQTIVNYAEEILSISVGIVVSLIDGVYNWFYDVFDFAGNWFSSSNNTLTVDLAVPFIEIASPANNYQTNNNQIEINYSIRETNLGSCWFDDQGYSSNNILSACSNISNFLWMDGWHNLTIWSNDSTGNINSSNISFLVDSTPPEVSLNFPEDGYSSSESYTTQIIVNCSATDNLRVKNISLYITNYQNLNMDFYELVPAVGTSGNASWTLNLGKGEYSWNCLASDDLGNSRFAESNRSIILNFSDADDDTIGDSVDNLKGNENSPIVSGINRLNITVGGNSTYGSYNDTREIIFYNSTQRIMNFTFNFTNSSLDLGKIRIIKTVNSLIVNLSGQLQEGYRKTIYIEDNNFAELCVKDSEVTNISEISTGCGEPDETNFTDCLGNSSGVTRNTLLCKDTGEIIEIGNLMYSAARGTCAVEEVVDVPTGSSGSGGGGGSLNISKVECTKNVECGAGNYCFEKKCYKGECTNNSQCSKDTYCFDFRCVKLFDIKIIDIDSPIGAGSFLSFTYYLKAMAEINNDVVVDFWLEKNGEKISSGKDTIYIGNKEEKTENTKIFIPKKVEPGVYDFYISVTFEKYSAQSSRQIEIDEWGNVVIFSVRNIFVYVTLFLILIIVLLLGFIYKMRKRRIQDALDYERRWILTHKFSLAILYLILASLALIGILAFLKIITLPSFTDYILTTENFIRYLVKPYLTLILGITVGILLFSYFLRYRRRNIFRKLYGEGFIPKVENYSENFLRRLKRKVELEKELFILRIRKRRSANRRLVGKIGEQIEEEKKLLIKELKPKKSKEERIRDKKIAEWKKKGYDVDVIQGENREKLIKEWKKKGYDTEVIEGKSMSEIVKEWKKKGYDVEALGDSFKNP